MALNNKKLELEQAQAHLVSIESNSHNEYSDKVEKQRFLDTLNLELAETQAECQHLTEKLEKGSKENENSRSINSEQKRSAVY